MAPFPDADHSVQPSNVTNVYYKMYGGLFIALRGAKWLLKPHAVNVTAASSPSSTLVANVFELPHAPGLATLWAVMLGGGDGVTTATLSVGYLPPASAGNALTFEVLRPGEGSAWSVLPASAVVMGEDAGTTAKLTVPLKRGCAMVRVKPE